MINGFVGRCLVALTLMASPALAQDRNLEDCEKSATLLESVIKIRDKGATENEAKSVILKGGWSSETADVIVMYAYLLFQDFTPRKAYYRLMSMCFSE
jgi:hypothetical protein